MKAQASINAGVCGFISNITVTCKSMFESACIKIETNCDKIRKYSELVQEVAPMNEITMGFDGKIMSEARKALGG